MLLMKEYHLFLRGKFDSWFSTTASVFSNRHLLMMIGRMIGATLKILNALSYLILTKLLWFLSYMD